MSRHETEALRGYVLPHGRVAHLIREESLKALCGVRPWPDDWCFHVTDARALPLCVDCLHIVARPKRKTKR